MGHVQVNKITVERSVDKCQLIIFKYPLFLVQNQYKFIHSYHRYRSAVLVLWIQAGTVGSAKIQIQFYLRFTR
jgi:hypothetical protein